MRLPPAAAWVLAGVWLVASAAASASSAAPIQPDLPAQIEAIDRAVSDRMRRSNTPGAAVALVVGGEVVWAKGYGLADRERGLPVTPDSVFNVASISKSVTAWGAMRLVEAGQVEIDLPVSRYLSSWQLPPSEFDLAGVTLRRLLSHTAGLAPTEYLGYLSGEPLPAFDTILNQGNGRTPGVSLNAPPGSRFVYSDAGYLLVQRMIEDVTGLPFAVYMQREVLDPLQMPASSFDPSPEQLSRTVTSYDPDQRPLPLYRFVEQGPAGLFTTAPGLAQFVAAGMSGPAGLLPGRGVLRPGTLAEMYKPQAEIRGFERLIYADGYGLGYYTEGLAGGVELISHMGANLNGVTEFAAIPALGEGIVVLTTSMSGHEVFADALHVWIRGLGYDAITLPRAIRTARAGMFVLAGGLCAAGLLLTLSSGTAIKSSSTVLATGRRSQRTFRILLAALVGGLLLAVYFLQVHAWVRLTMPSAAPWIAVGWSWLCTAGAVWAGLRSSA